MAQARFTATVDLPTPPLPLATAITWRTWAGFSAPVGCCGCIWAWASLDRRAPPRRTLTVPGAWKGSAGAAAAAGGGPPAVSVAVVSTTWARSTPGTPSSAASAASLMGP